MIGTEVFYGKRRRRSRLLAWALVCQFLAGPFGVLLSGAVSSAALPDETQESASEVITARFVFNGTDGSYYNGTAWGSSGAVLGNLTRSFDFGQGWWGKGATLDRVAVRYPGNLSLAAQGSANEVFHARSNAAPRDRDANGTTVWTASAPSDSYHAGAFDQDGDGWLDDAVIAYTGTANRYHTFNQGGTQIGARNLAPGGPWLNDVAAVDPDSNGALDQLAFAHQGGRVYVERAAATNVWNVVVPGNAPVRFVAAVDLNADGFLEAVLASVDDFDFADDEEVYAYGATGLLRWTYNTGGVGVVNLTGIEASGSHRLNGALVATNDSVAVLGPAGQVVWNWSANATVTAATAVDFDRDGIVEGAAYADDAGGISYLNGTGALIAWSAWLSPTIRSLDSIDLDGDGWLNEVVAANSTAVAGFDAAGAWLWNASVGPGFRVNMVAHADLDGNGTYGDTIVPTSDTLYAFNRTGALRWSVSEGRNLRSAAFITNPSASPAGSYTSPELDAGFTTSWANLTFGFAVNSTNENVTAAVRFGDGSPGSVSWGAWGANLSGPFLDLSGNVSRFAQVHFDFTSADGRNSANVSWMRLNYTAPADAGSVETQPFAPSPPAQWLDLDAQGNTSGGALRFFYSADGGALWRAFLPGESVDGGNASAPSLRFRVEMDRGAGSPDVAWVSVRYAQSGLRPAVASPTANSTVTGEINLTAVADPLIVGLRFDYVRPTNVTFGVGAAAFDAGTGRWWALWNTTGLGGAGYSVVAVGTDARGFRFSSPRLPITVDNAPPLVAFVDPTNNGNLTGVVNLVATASLDAVSVSFSYDNGTAVVPIGFATQTSPGRWELSFDTTGFGEIDSVALFVTAVDAVGLAGTGSVTVAIDNVGPFVRIDAPRPFTNISGVFKVILNASKDVVRIDLNENGSLGQAVLRPGGSNSSWWTFDWLTLEFLNTSATLTATATDRVGFQAQDAVANLTIDNTEPKPVLVAPLNSSANTGVVHMAARAPANAVRVNFSYLAQGEEVRIRSMAASEANASSGLFEFDWDTRSPTRVDFSGIIIVTATNSFGRTGTYNSSLIVVDNTPPFVHITAPTFGEIRVAENYTVEAYADDDVVSVTLSYRNESSGANVALGNMVRTNASLTRWTYPWQVGSLFVPSATLRVTAVDRVGFTTVDTFADLIIGLNPGDAPPTIVRSPTDIIVDEDFGMVELNLTGLVSDDDPANLTAYIDGAPPALVTLRNSGSRGLAPIWFFSVQDAHSAGTQTPLTLRVVDSSGQTDTKGFGLYVQPRNDAPVWDNPRTPIYVHGGTPYKMDFSYYVRDPEFESEGAPLFIAALPSDHITQDGGSRLALVFDYGASEVGTSFPVTLSLTDGDSTLQAALFDITVIVTADEVPRLKDDQPLPPVLLQEDTPRFNVIDLSLNFSDADDALLYYYTGLPPGFEILLEGGNVSFTKLPKDWYGTTYTFFGANDSTGAFAESRVAVIVEPVNDAPEWDFSRGLNISSFYVHFDEPFAFDLSPYVIDVDDGPSKLTVVTSEPLHAGAPRDALGDVLPGEGLTLVFDFNESFNGTTRSVLLHITDGRANSTVFSATVNISSNFPPRVSVPLPAEILIKEGAALANALNLSLFFTDRDGVLFFAYGLVNVKVSINNTTGWMSLESLGEWAGTERLVLRAIDERGAFVDSSILVTVVPIDDPPRFVGKIPDIIVEAGKLGTLPDLLLYVFDVDTNASRLSLTATTSYPDAFVSIVDGSLRFIYPVPREGAVQPSAFDTIRFCVSDGTTAKCSLISVAIRQAAAAPFNWVMFFTFVGTAGVAAIIVSRHFVEFKVKRAPTVEDIFLVYEDGILIKHLSKKVRKYADEDVVTSMLSAIQSFAADSFEDTEHWELREITFQGRKILIEKARKFQVFLIFDGDANEDLKKAVKGAADAIAIEYKEHLKDWDGDPSHFDGVDKVFAPLFSMERAFVPEKVSADELVKAPLVPGGVYVSEGGGFQSLLKPYIDDIKGLAVIRVRPAGDPGAPIAPLKPEEVEIVEVPPPKGAPEEEGDGDGRTGLDVALDALKEALSDSKVAVRGRAPLVLFEGFEFIVDRYGFVYSKKFADQLKRLAAAEGFYLFVAVDPKALSAQQLEGLERGAVVLRGE